MEILIVILLIILNGILAMAEIAIVSSRKSKLQQQANEGSKNAEVALSLAKSPNIFLPTVQIGITLVGVFAGAFGGATIAASLTKQLQKIPTLGPYSSFISLIVVVSLITFFSLLGELIPKRIALNSPEKIAKVFARPMQLLSKISSPLVSFLSLITDWFIRLFHIKALPEPTVTDEEVRLLFREGTKTGVFEMAERDIVDRTLQLSEKRVNTLMTSRKEVVWLDVDSSFKSIRNKITRSPHAHYPVCRDSLDKVIGIVRTESLLIDFLAQEKIDLKKLLHKPLFIPESMAGLKVLEVFKKSGTHLALVVDEYGNVQGLVSLTDILESIVGDIPTMNEFEEKGITKRDNEVYVVDGLVTIDEFKEYFHLKKLPEEKTGAYHTIGGFVMHKLGRIPIIGDKFDWAQFHFEVINMDENRIDKVLIAQMQK